MGVSERRDEIRRKLGKIQREVFKAFENDTTSKYADDLVAETKAMRAEWLIVRGLCNNQFHKLSEEKRKNKVCSDCGIRQFEWVVEKI